jgi:methionine-rich copper-binding protein CopC
MAHDYHLTNTHLSHTRTIRHTMFAILMVTLLAVASGVAFSMHDNKAQSASQFPDTPVNNQSALPVDDPSTSKEKAEPMTNPDDSNSTSSPGTTNNSHATTTITVNGKTTTVSGNGSVDNSYTSPDGHTNVHINVNNTQSSVRKSLDSVE